jgi:hypothetical protein
MSADSDGWAGGADACNNVSQALSKRKEGWGRARSERRRKGKRAIESMRKSGIREK